MFAQCLALLKVWKSKRMKILEDVKRLAGAKCALMLYKPRGKKVKDIHTC